MGNWNINIQGIGHHHNAKDNPYASTDADVMANDFAKALVKSGHAVQDATFTYGGAESLAIETAPKPQTKGE